MRKKQAFFSKLWFPLSATKGPGGPAVVVDVPCDAPAICYMGSGGSGGSEGAVYPGAHSLAVVPALWFPHCPT